MLVCLTWTLCVPSTAQSVNANIWQLRGRLPIRNVSAYTQLKTVPDPTNDSVGVTRAFLQNARPLLDSLTALHFCRLRISFLEARLNRTETLLDTMAIQYAASRADASKLAFTLFDTKNVLGQQRQKRRRDQVENWVWRIGAAALIWRQLRPFLPP